MPTDVRVRGKMPEEGRVTSAAGADEGTRIEGVVILAAGTASRSGLSGSLGS